MELSLPYGQETVKINIPEARVQGTITPNSVEIGDESKTVRNALDNPINSKRFSDFISDANDVLFIVNDATRPTPTAKVLDILYDEIINLNMKIIIATGTHRPPTEEELEFIFGSHLDFFRDNILIHDSKDEKILEYLDTTPRGTKMYINRAALSAHKIVIISSVEPHYFAGYTGGRKSFLPGLAAYKTIEQNHKFALEPEAKTLALKGNPVHEDMKDAVAKMMDKEIFNINLVLDNDHNIYSATAGELQSSFSAAIEKANDVFCVKVADKADIVVSVAPYPMDIDLYQSQKAIDNGKLALREDGILILVSKCRTGVGHDNFVKLMASSDTPKGTLDYIAKEYRVGYHKAAKLAEIALWAEMWAVTDLDDDILKSVFMKPYHDLQQALDDALEKKGPDAKILFMPNGSITIPLINKTSC
jgi:nickel-dependent lactate racemase